MPSGGKTAEELKDCEAALGSHVSTVPVDVCLSRLYLDVSECIWVCLCLCVVEGFTCRSCVHVSKCAHPCVHEGF